MDLTLSSGKTITLDKDEVVTCPRAEGLRWLKEYIQSKEATRKPPVEEMTAEQCYDELDRLSNHRRNHGRGRSPDAYQARHYCDVMKKKVKARLKELGARPTRPGDTRVYGPGQRAWQRAGG